MLANIIDVTGLTGTTVQITFDSAIDGTTLDADFLQDDNTGSITTGFNSQVDAVTVIFNNVVFVGFGSGDPWSLVRAQPDLAFPQSGFVT